MCWQGYKETGHLHTVDGIVEMVKPLGKRVLRFLKKKMRLPYGQVGFKGGISGKEPAWPMREM